MGDRVDWCVSTRKLELQEKASLSHDLEQNLATMAMRSSRRLLLSISRQLDMGGMPSASSMPPVRGVDTSKNCKVRAIAFDFDMLTRSIQEQEKKDKADSSKAKTRDEHETQGDGSILPDVGMVQEMAKLLNVNLGGEANKTSNEPTDDLSRLTQGDSRPTPNDDAPPPISSRANEQQQQKTSLSSSSSSSPFHGDIRDKYAAKLKRKLDGGVMGVERAKEEAETALKRGDASGHLAARNIAVSQGSQKWMALSGTGSLLQYISNRGLKLVLLPVPNNDFSHDEERKMQDFTKQLPRVIFDVLLTEGEEVTEILDQTQEELGLDPVVTMVVSDRDDYLREAKKSGMITCRVRFQPNAPRGNITAHYNVEAISDVQEVVDDINGISFNAVFAAGTKS